MAKFDTSMLPRPRDPYRVSELQLGQSRFVSEGALSALGDGTALIRLAAPVRKQRSFLHPVRVSRSSNGYSVEVPLGFKLTSTRKRSPPGHTEVLGVSVGGRRPEPGPPDYVEGVVSLVRLLAE